MKTLKRIYVTLALVGVLFGGMLAGTALSQARATTTTGVVTIRSIISGTITSIAGTGTATGALGGVTLCNDVTATGSTGAGGNTDTTTCTIAANTLSANGQQLHVTASFLHAANTNATSFWAKVFGTLATGGTCAVSAGTGAIDLWVTRISSTVATVQGYDNGCGGLVNEIGRRTSLDFTMANTIILTINAATTTNDILTQHLRVVWYP